MPDPARGGAPGADRVSRRGIAVAGALMVALIGAFVALAIVSFNALHGDAGRDTQAASTLPPVTIGAQRTVLDWTKDACGPYDYADLPTRAYRDSQGQVQLIVSHFVNRRMSGPSLGRVRHSCDILLSSNRQADPAQFDDLQWIAAPYTPDGRTVYALLHNEYQGQRHPGRCPSGQYFKCWYNAITLAVSHDGGRTFSHSRPPRHLVASIPYRYAPDKGPSGIFTPSNIVRNPDDGLYYALVVAQGHRAQKQGACLIRTADLSDPGAWRAWDGSSFGIRFVDPYRAATTKPATRVCAPVSLNAIATMSESLTYSTHFGKWLLVGTAGAWDRSSQEVVWGVYYSLSKDLIDWEPRRLIREAELPWTYRCGDANPILYPSVLDNHSKSRNFETVGKSAWLYFTRMHYKDCKQTSDRDLVRVPITFH